MLGILLTVFIFFLTAVVHLLLYKTIGERTLTGVKLFFTVFFTGFIIETVLLIWFLPQNISLPLSSILFYLLSTGIYLIVYLGAFLGDESPATKIFLQIKKKGKMTSRNLFRIFSDSELVIKRLDEMEKIGWISGKKGFYSLTDVGLRIIKVISIYQKILKWERSG